MLKTVLGLAVATAILFNTATPVFASGTGSAQFSVNSTQINWVNLEDGVEIASQENKPLMVYIYSDNDPSCKELDKETYADSNLAKHINENFVAIKINGDSRKRVGSLGITEEQLVASMELEEYPFIVLFNAELDLIDYGYGFISAKDLYEALNYAIDENAGITDFHLSKEPV